MAALSQSVAPRAALPYDEEVVRLFTIATLFWGVVAFTMGTFIALQLAYPALNLGLDWTTFGRLRPVHTSAAIFAFLTSWNEYALASQLTRTTASKTMPVGLMDFTAQFTVDWAGMSAMAVLIIIPALVLTFIVQKHLIAGLTFGGVKG